MSNILRRPMFRGGRVSSYGNGIASGLADGGRVGYQGGGAINNWFSRIAGQAPKGGVGPATTGSSLLQDALSKVKNVPYLGRVASPIINLGSKASPYVLAGGAGYGLGTLADFLYEGMSTPEKYIETKRIGEEEPFAYAETDLITDEYGNMTSRGQQIDQYLGELNVGEKPGFFPRGGREKFMRDRGYDLKTGKKISDMPFEVSGEVAQVKPGETALDAILRQAAESKKTPPPANNEDGPQPTALTREEEIAKNKELFRKELGYDEARRSDIGDLLGRISVAALKRPGRGEKRDLGDIAGDVMQMELAAGPGKREKINQAAATLAINDYVAGKRSREQTQEILAKIRFDTDYKIEATDKNISVKGKDFTKALAMEAKRQDAKLNDDKVIKSVIYQQTDGKESPISINVYQNENYNPNTNIDPNKLQKGLNIIKFKNKKIMMRKNQDGSLEFAQEYPLYS
jgi:hypothetical protein